MDPVSSSSEEDTSERNRDEAYQDQVDIGRDVYDSEGGANVVVDVDQHKFIITDEAFTALLEKFNEDQARILDEVRQQARNIYAATEGITARPKPIQWFLTGGAGAKLEEVREPFLGVEFLIIDEVSMLGYPGLVAVHQRLQQIRD
ncbi:hypothetical protein FOZ62_005634, partial [Perkinsus olseni]